MLTRLELEQFKCFELLRLPLAPLTLLSGANGSGKSSVMQALVLLHQTMREQEWSRRLVLNGTDVRLGSVADVVDKTHGRRSLRISASTAECSVGWVFSGDRTDMSMTVDAVQIDGIEDSAPEFLRFLLPERLHDPSAELVAQIRDLTYVTAERIGPRELYALEDRLATTSVGPRGEHAASVLHWGRDELVTKDLVIDDVPGTRLRQVERRMQEFFPGCGLILQQVPQTNGVTLGLRTSSDTDFHRPVHVGFGLTQVLPIVVAALSADRGDLLLVENPEVHLHPSGQALMGKFLADVASAGIQVIVETHSDHLLNGIRRAVRDFRLPASDVGLHFFQARDHGPSQVTSPMIDELGNLDAWPKGFFDQYDVDTTYFAGWNRSMELAFNELSVNGQFTSIATFRDAIARVMEMRSVARQHGRDIYCHQQATMSRVTSTMVISQVLGDLRIDERRSLMQWLTKGPYWDSSRVHQPTDRAECQGSVIRDCALLESAHRVFLGEDWRVASAIPSPYDASPLSVMSNDFAVDVLNYRTAAALDAALRDLPAEIGGWRQLADHCALRFANLTFSPTAFRPLDGHPYVSSAASRILQLLDVLNRSVESFDAEGRRTIAGQQLHDTFFIGDRAAFSDSSSSEKQDFADDLTFPHPTEDDAVLFCPWHGKVNTPKLRIHFSGPAAFSEPLFVAYVGPKITRR